MTKVILDLCGGTHSWCVGYNEYNKLHPWTYKCYNITKPNYCIEDFYYEDNCLWFPGEKVLIFRPNEIYGILAAPPCTHFSFARQNAKTPRDLPGAFEIVKKCLEIIWVCALYGNLKFWCLENPSGYLYHFLGKPAFKFRPAEFGDQANKITWLWGNFNFPRKLKKPVNVPIGKHRESESYPSGGNKIKRAITPPGFANAFFKANR